MFYKINPVQKIKNTSLKNCLISPKLIAPLMRLMSDCFVI